MEQGLSGKIRGGVRMKTVLGDVRALSPRWAWEEKHTREEPALSGAMALLSPRSVPSQEPCQRSRDTAE